MLALRKLFSYNNFTAMKRFETRKEMFGEFPAGYERVLQGFAKAAERAKAREAEIAREKAFQKKLEAEKEPKVAVEAPKPRTAKTVNAIRDFFVRAARITGYSLRRRDPNVSFVWFRHFCVLGVSREWLFRKSRYLTAKAKTAYIFCFGPLRFYMVENYETNWGDS